MSTQKETSYDGDGSDLVAGDHLTSPRRRYVIKEVLGKGGYGCVFRVIPDPPVMGGEEFALKLEKRRDNRNHPKLTMEVHIMKLLSRMEYEKRNHFIDVVDRAKKDKFYFVVMTLLGPSLADLKREKSPAIFSAACAYALGMQCLEGLEQLHSVGYIHRDIKPGNYAVGRGPRKHTVYILDFGIARYIFNKKKEIKGPRIKVGFKGTLRYAPVNCHLGEELGRKDDCESWCYMIADMSNPNELPWKGMKVRDTVKNLKIAARTSPGDERTFRGLDHVIMREILIYLDNVMYSDDVDYNFLYVKIKTAGKPLGLSPETPYDWEVDKSEGSRSSTMSRHKGEKTNTQMISIRK